MSLVVQIVFFVLTLIALSGFYGFWRLVNAPAGAIVLVCSIAIAELLILKMHFWRTGVESALWLGGLYAFIFSLPSTGAKEAILVLAAAAALAGWRVRNAIFGTLAAVLVIVYFAARDWNWGALSLAIAIAFVALAGLAAEWKRPSTEMLWTVLALAMPVAGYVAVAVREPQGFHSDTRIVLTFLVVAAVFLIAGIRQRLRIPLVAGVISIAIAIVEAHDYNPVSLETELIILGAITMAVAAMIMRSLRGKTTGFVLGAPKQSDLRDVLSVAPTLLSVHAGDGAPPASQHTGGGGGFGGAGASGNF